MQLADSWIVFQFVNSQMDETFCFLVSVFDGEKNPRTLYLVPVVTHCWKYLQIFKEIKPETKAWFTDKNTYFFLLKDLDISSLSDIL